jgi:hypothetical protein
MAVKIKKVTPDKRGRVSLKGMVEGFDGYEASLEADGTIVLKPYIAVHPREAWLYENPEILKNLDESITQAGRGELHDLGDFTQYADLEPDK